MEKNEEEIIDEATREVVAAIERSAEQIVAALDRCAESVERALQDQTDRLANEIGGITGP